MLRMIVSYRAIGRSEIGVCSIDVRAYRCGLLRKCRDK